MGSIPAILGIKNKLCIYELQPDLKNWCPVDDSFTLAKNPSKGSKKNKPSVRTKSENKKFSKKRFTKKSTFRVKAPKWAVWNEPTSIKVPTRPQIKRDKPKRRGIYNTPRSSYRPHPYRPKKFSTSGPHLPRKNFKIRSTTKYRSASLKHSLGWSIRRKAYVLRYAKPRLRKLKLSRLALFAQKQYTSAQTWRRVNRHQTALPVQSPRLFGRYFVTAPSRRSWTYNRLQSKLARANLLMQGNRVLRWGTEPSRAALTTSRNWVGIRYGRLFNKVPNHFMIQNKVGYRSRRIATKVHRFNNFKDWKIARLWGWKRHQWRQTRKRLVQIDRLALDTSFLPKKYAPKKLTRVSIYRSRFKKKKKFHKRSVPTSLPPKTTLLLKRKLKTGRVRFRTERWTARERTRFYGRWRDRQRKKSLMNSLRTRPSSPMTIRRRTALTWYTKISQSKPYISYKILKLKGKRSHFKRKRVLRNVLRFTRKLRKLTPAFKLTELYRSRPYGSIEALPSSRKALFFFKKHGTYSGQAFKLNPLTGYFASVEILKPEYSVLYLISTFAKTLYQVIEAFQSRYFLAFLNRWDVLAQLLWVNYNRKRGFTASWAAKRKNSKSLAHFYLKHDLPIKSTRSKSKALRRGKKKGKKSWLRFASPEKKRCSKLYSKLFRKARISRLKMKVLVRLANALNLAGRSRTLSYLKNALRVESKRKFLGYEIGHNELFERDLIVVNYRYKAYSAFECFYNHKRDFRRTRFLADGLNVYRNDDRFENSFTRWTLKNYSTLGQSRSGNLLDLLYANHLRFAKRFKPRNRHALEKKLSGKAKRFKARLFFTGRRRRWSRRLQRLLSTTDLSVPLKTRMQRRRLSRRYSSTKMTRFGFGVRRQLLPTSAYLPNYSTGDHFNPKFGSSEVLLNPTTDPRSFAGDYPKFRSQASQYAHLTQNIFFLKKIVSNSSLYKYTLLKLPHKPASVTPKAYSLDTLDGLYFGSRAEQLKTSNVWHASNFSYTMRRRVLKLFSFSSFNVNVTMWYYNNLIRFIQNCTGRKVWLTLYSNIENELSFADLARCNLWQRRLSGFQRLLGPKIFLKESLRVMHLVVNLKDPALLLNWIKVMLSKMSFWKYRLLFRYIKFVMRYFFWVHFKKLGFRGLKLKLKGKISVAGNARTRTLRYSIGENSHATLDNRVAHEISTISTFTGVLGFQVWVFY